MKIWDIIIKYIKCHEWVNSHKCRKYALAIIYKKLYNANVKKNILQGRKRYTNSKNTINTVFSEVIDNLFTPFLHQIQKKSLNNYDRHFSNDLSVFKFSKLINLMPPYIYEILRHIFFCIKFLKFAHDLERIFKKFLSENF